MTARAILSVFLLVLALVRPAFGAALRDGIAAFNRHDYVLAARVLVPLAERGDPRAQLYIGFMYADGRGLPQNYIEAALWYRQASEQGNAPAQYMLGLMYDKGHGVPQNYVEAYKWLILAAAAGRGKDRLIWVKIRDAVASKLSLVQLTEGQRRALEWQELRYRPILLLR